MNKCGKIWRQVSAPHRSSKAHFAPVVFGCAVVLPCLLSFLAVLVPSRSDATHAPPAITPEQAEFFETRVRPVLVANCYGCHSKDAQMAGLRVDSREALLKGGSSGTSLIPGDAEKSLLIQAIRHSGALKMPKTGKLTDAQIGDLTAWVRGGAPWPAINAVSEAAVANGEALLPAQRKFWSLQPVRVPALPTVKNIAWVKSPIDRFVLAKLEANNLTPNPPADRRTLIRRVYFDLIGLSPADSDVTAFVADKSPDAFAKVVDRLLASPQYGERWARYWLDIARYADTKGYVFNEDRAYPNAYTYRAWVIDALNKDMPYDQFVVNQIAADRLPITNDNERRNLAALGYLTVGRRFLNNSADIMDDRIDVTMRGMQGLTVACARCHDHKFDPIPTKDYYSLYGIFASANETAPAISPAVISDPYTKHRDSHDAVKRDRDNLIRAQVESLRAKQKAGTEFPKSVTDALKSFREKQLPDDKKRAELMPAFDTEARTKILALDMEEARLAKSYPTAPELAMGLEDAKNPNNPVVFKRGNPSNRGDAVPRRFLLALSPENTPREAWKTSGRLEMAQKIASKQNPLTARVFVNRAWLWHFGQGIVRTPSDFGKQGERPTHPELLDWLAATFMQDGWSIKRLHRRILLSATYQQSSDLSEKQLNADPENRLIGRMNRRRLDLETLRDRLFAASGTLETKQIGGPSVELWTPVNGTYSRRRAVYGRIERQNLPGIFKTFDFASPDATTAQRFRTTVPQQALFLMNNPLALEQARLLAARSAKFVSTGSPANADVARVNALYRILFNRTPTLEEKSLAMRFLKAPTPPVPIEDRPELAWRYGWGAYDEAASTVKFTPFTVFVEDQWRPSPQLPSPEYNWVFLSREGGHPGVDANHCAIRRWVAPMDGTFLVTGTLRHNDKQGDGVRGRLISNRGGLHGEWMAQNTKVNTRAEKLVLKKGDTLDFVLDPRKDNAFDTFEWAPTVQLVGEATTARVWSAADLYSGPAGKDSRFTPLTAWERYAQALLMSNEFMFVD